MYGTVLKKIKASGTVGIIACIVMLPSLCFDFLSLKMLKVAKRNPWNNSANTAGLFFIIAIIFLLVGAVIWFFSIGQMCQQIKVCQSGLIGRYKSSAVGVTKLNCSYNEIADVVCENSDIVICMKSGASFRFVNMKDAYNGTAYIKRMISKQENIPYANTMQYHQ